MIVAVVTAEQLYLPEKTNEVVHRLAAVNPAVSKPWYPWRLGRPTETRGWAGRSYPGARRHLGEGAMRTSLLPAMLLAVAAIGCAPRIELHGPLSVALDFGALDLSSLGREITVRASAVATAQRLVWQRDPAQLVSRTFNCTLTEETTRPSASPDRPHDWRILAVDGGESDDDLVALDDQQAAELDGLAAGCQEEQAPAGIPSADYPRQVTIYLRSTQSQRPSVLALEVGVRVVDADAGISRAETVVRSVRALSDFERQVLGRRLERARDGNPSSQPGPRK